VKRILSLSVLAALAVGLLLSGCKPKSEIKIGAILPLTGDIAVYGQGCKEGIDMALHDIDTSRLLGGRRISVIYDDDQAKPDAGVTAIQKQITVDKVRAIIGAVASSVTLAIEPIATKNRVILFSPGSSSPKLTGISRYFFRTWPSDVFEAAALAEFVSGQLHIKKVAILYVNNDYGVGLENEFSRRFAELGGQVVAVESYDQGASDFRTQLSKLSAASPEAIYLAGVHREMALATKQIREARLRVQILGDADYGVQELLSMAGGAAEGAIYSTPQYDPVNGTGAVRAFADAFRGKYGKYPGPFESNAYDAMMIIAKAIAQVGTDPDRMAEYIRSLHAYQGASGTVSFAANNEVSKPASIKMVKQGEFVDYAP